MPRYEIEEVTLSEVRTVWHVVANNHAEAKRRFEEGDRALVEEVTGDCRAVLSLDIRRVK